MVSSRSNIDRNQHDLEIMLNAPENRLLNNIKIEKVGYILSKSAMHGLKVTH